MKHQSQYLRGTLKEIRIPRSFSGTVYLKRFSLFPFTRQCTIAQSRSAPIIPIQTDKNGCEAFKKDVRQRPSDLQYQDSSNSSSKTSEFEINLGKSIDGIRADFHGFLDDGLLYTDIYSSDILFEEPYHSGLKIQGRHLYIMFSKLARISLLWYYQDVTLTLTHFQLRKSGGNDLFPENPKVETDLSNTTSLMRSVSKEGSRPDPGFLPSLYARFILEGTPRPALLLSLPLAAPLPRKTYTVLFKYRFHPTGLISHHVVEKIQPAPDLASLFPRVAWWWWFRGAKPDFHA